MSRQGFAHAIGWRTTSSWLPTCARLPQLVGGPWLWPSLTFSRLMIV